VENLFHPAHDSVAGEPKEDLEWMPEGSRRWSYKRYYQKEENIARVLTNIGEWEGVDVVGLQEVENAAVVKRMCYTLRRNTHDFVHYESPDKRGIDVALMYKKARVDTLATRVLHVDISPETTRDILYVCAKVDKLDTVHFFVCHMPSQRGGKAESEWKREAAKKTLQSAIDSIYWAFRYPKIVVMGDFNSEPKEDLRGVKNRMITPPNLPTREELKGTHKYQGRWTCLDQFYTSPALDSVSSVTIYDAEWIQEPDEKHLGLKPKRTYNGFIYQKDGFSDHLPIVLTISL
jgi:endonuclease/exonuclease/phosphatase family metal-dependent hydrolase